MPTTTPKVIDASTAAFCRKLNMTSSPSFIEVCPDADAQAGDCFFNIKRKIEKEYGTIIYGWNIWIWPNVFIEAEHHAIWQSPDGTLVDITPRVQGEKRILFVRDDIKIYDFEQNKRIDNIRQALTNDPDINLFLSSAAEYSAFQEKYSTGLTINAPQDEFQELIMRHYQNLQRLYRRYLGRNDLCTCNSAKKVKNCCGLEKAITMGFSLSKTIND